jgi:short-subunit dehydrogenase
MDLNGMTCLVTGASRGIGRALAEQLAQRPVRLLLGLREPDGDLPLATGALDVRAVHLDLSSKESIARCWEASAAELEQVDVLINNAGAIAAGQLEQQSLDDIHDVIAVNLAGSIDLARRVLPHMLQRRRGKIVSMGSVLGYASFPGLSTYVASKAGMAAFSESLRRELAESPVSVLEVVSPAVDTEMLDVAKERLEANLIDNEHWEQYDAGGWAAKVIDAIEDDEDVLGPGGRSALAKLASRGPAALLDTASRLAFSRTAD